MILALMLLSVRLAAAEVPPTPAPPANSTVAALKERFLAATDDVERARTLELIAATNPTSARDVSALFDLFSRFPDAIVRQKSMESLARLHPGMPELEPLFMTYLRQDEPESQLFGINGAFRLRSEDALPMVRRIAQRRFKAPAAASIDALSERNAWWTQYEALSALAQWQGEKSESLLVKKSQESPAVAHLLGQFFWSRTLPRIAQWSRSSKLGDRQRAVEASGAPIEPAEARATRDAMLTLVGDTTVDAEVRHKLALKVGAVSDDGEVSALIAKHDSAGDAKTRLLWASAVFASHNMKAVPLLEKYARNDPDELMRRGARALLVDLLGEEKVSALLKDDKVNKK